MLLQTAPWESHLLNLARQALNQASHAHRTILDTNLLRDAYRFCEGITRQHSRTFTLASSLLPRHKRQAVRALYAFCRLSDDIVDRKRDGDPLIELSAWRERILASHPSPNDLVAVAWSDTRLKYGVPLLYVEQLLDGVASDLTKRRYQSFDELAMYAYRVASTVGLMAMHIIGYSGEDAVPNAIKLGIALQLTNILRDVQEDLQNGRVYLPQDELAQFGISEADLATGKVTPQWRRFMRFQIDRVRRLFAESFAGISMLNQDGRFSIAAAALLYEGILDEIEAQDYDVFSRRAHVSLFGKLSRLPGIWAKAQRPNEVTIWYDQQRIDG
jgi:15-cis-phytoene synthase